MIIANSILNWIFMIMIIMIITIFISMVIAIMVKNLQAALDLQASCPHPGDNSYENTDLDFFATSNRHVYDLT